MFRRQPPTRRGVAPGARPIRPAALRPGARPGGGIRRTKPVRRASAGLTPVRAGAGLAILVAAGGLYGAVSSDLFNAGATDVTGNTWTSDDAIVAAMAVPAGQNVFTLKSSELEGRIEALPSVAHAEVRVVLPDRIAVEVAEWTALLGWRVGDRTFLVAADGTLFGELADDASEAASALPRIIDRRAESEGLEVGAVIDAVSLDAALRLGSLTAADVGSTATSLQIRVDDTHGFVLRAEPADWNAIFGFYTPTLRTTELIPGQVRLLRSLMLANDEDNVVRVILADERSGTWVPRATVTPSESPKP